MAVSLKPVFLVTQACAAGHAGGELGPDHQSHLPGSPDRWRHRPALCGIDHGPTHSYGTPLAKGGITVNPKSVTPRLLRDIMKRGFLDPADNHLHQEELL